MNNDFLIKRPQKKTLIILLIIAAAAVFLMFLSSYLTGSTEHTGESAVTEKKGNGDVVQTSQITAAENLIEKRLEDVLGQVAGVGKVTAEVNLASTPEHVYKEKKSNTEKTTEEKDQRGGSRIITENSENTELVLLHETSGGGETPVLAKEVKPEVQGVMIVADGAADAEIKAEIILAVETLLHVPPHRVIVLPRERR